MAQTVGTATRRGAASPASLNRERFQDRFEAIAANMEKVIKGKPEAVRLVLVATLAEGHVLLEDMPGTGKTMLARSLAETISCTQTRVQCTPDLLPSDVTGSPVLDMRTHEFVFRRGPVFANVLLVDEINRATPKTQSALLEAMQEKNVTVDGVTHPLPDPFMMIATQNPIELAGTFPLPEAQLDRFLFKLTLGYPDRNAEAMVVKGNVRKLSVLDLKPVTDGAEILELIEWAKSVEVSDAVTMYIVDLVQATRSDPSLLSGASSRAAIGIHRAAQVIAASNGRDHVYPDDVKRVLTSALVHRCLLSPEASLRDETVEKVIDRVIARVKPPVDAVAG